jgi:hypothetical protein
MLIETRPFKENGQKLLSLTSSRREMLLKVIGQPLGTAKRVLDSRWVLLKGYWKAAGKYLKRIE